MTPPPRFDPELSIPYTLVWRWIHLSVHRYGSLPTGALLVVLTIIVLHQSGYHPTVTELAEITGLPKSSISRYVSEQMSAGFLEEYIDPSDRRRRRLRPTHQAVHELKTYWDDSIRTVYKQVNSHDGNPTLRDDATVEEILAHLKATNHTVKWDGADPDEQRRPV